MAEAFIYDHVRTPRGRGKKDGALHEVSTAKLAAGALAAIRDRNELDAGAVGDVILGCVDPVGEAGGDIARSAVFAAGFPNSVPGLQINRYCASGLDAVNLASAVVKGGHHEMVIAGGVESMSRVGMGAAGNAWAMDPQVALPGYFVPQGISADLIATKYGFSRADGRCLCGREPEARRRRLGARLFREVGGAGPRHQRHHHPRPRRAHAAGHQHAGSRARSRPPSRSTARWAGSTRSASQAHPEVEAIEHVHHAGNSSGIVDGAAAVLVGSKKAGRKAGLTPRARIRDYTNIGSEPAIMLTGPVDVTKKLLKQAGMSLADIDLVEINEAFASVVLRYMQAFDLDPAKVNVNGGAIAMGHPLGATGAMILGTVLDELERRDLNTALVTLCIGAGMGTATIIERV